MRRVLPRLHRHNRFLENVTFLVTLILTAVAHDMVLLIVHVGVTLIAVASQLAHWRSRRPGRRRANARSRRKM